MMHRDLSQMPLAWFFIKLTVFVQNLTPTVCLLILGGSFLSTFSYVGESGSSTVFLATLKQEPFSSAAHLRLAEFYFRSGVIPAAQHEVQLVQDRAGFQKTPTVLGLSTQLEDLNLRLEKVPQYQHQQVAYWENVVQQHPNYRDAWVQLLYAAYNSQSLTKVSIYLSQIKSLDPNFTSTLTARLSSPK